VYSTIVSTVNGLSNQAVRTLLYEQIFSNRTLYLLTAGPTSSAKVRTNLIAK